MDSSLLPVQRKFFFRFFNFYKLFFYTFTKPRAVNRAFTRYILYKPNFFICLNFFRQYINFMIFSYLLLFLFRYLYSCYCSLMFCYVDRLIDESVLSFLIYVHLIFIWRNELSYRTWLYGAVLLRILRSTSLFGFIE